MNSDLKNPMTVYWLLLVFLLPSSLVQAAKVATRLHEDDGQYSGFPDSYPVCKSKMDYMHYDGTPTLAKRNLFETKLGWIEIGVYAVGVQFNGTEVVNRIRTYEDNGMDVAGVSLYREDWLATETPGGFFPIDWRILSPTELAAVRNAIATANPPLRCKNTVKLIQLLGSGSGAWGAGSAQNFPTMSVEVKEHLKLFDGLGVECHIGDHEIEDRKGVIIAMAAISKWAKDNGRTTFVFMGGGAGTYENLPKTQLTFRYLWNEMFKLGVDYRGENVVYFRQGAWPDGKHTPEAAYNTLMHQQRWVINTLKPDPGLPLTSLFISEVQPLMIATNAAATIPFFVGEAELEADLLTVGVSSSNPTLVPNSNLKIMGRGAARVLSVTPNSLQSGTTTITLTVHDGAISMSSSFLLTVAPATDFNAVVTGSVNDPGTWGGVIPIAGDTSIWHTGNKTLTMALAAADTFYGGTLEVETGGQFAPGIANPTLLLNNLVLDGGTISMANNSGLDMDLNGDRFLLKSGTIRSGSGSSMTVNFLDGTMAGDGTINITSAGTAGAVIDFKSTMTTQGFSGKFNISANGTLKLPPIPIDEASFGLILSGTGKLVNDQDVAITSLVIDGTSIPAGTYAYSDFTMAQRAFLVNTTGVITVITNTPPSLNPFVDTITNEDTSVTLPLTFNDLESSASSLTVSGFAADTRLIPPGSFAFNGSGANRSVTITPAANLSGTTTVTLVVSDGQFKATRTFAFTVLPVNDAPSLSAIASQSVVQDTSKLLTFTIGDVDNTVDSLTLTAVSSNTALLPNSSLSITGSGVSRSLTMTPSAFQEGSTTITLAVSDGVLVAVTNFLLTVTPPHTVIAPSGGQLNNPVTWGVPIPTAGDTTSWRSGANNLSMATGTETFHGMSLVIQTGGQLAPGVPSANLTLNNLVLSGGLITMANNIGLNIDLSGKIFTLMSGTLKAGGTNNGRDVRFKNGSLAGTGTIAITGTDATGSDVEFQSTVNTKGFTGIFDVKQNGILNLPAIPSASASFGISLTGTGRYSNDANVTLTSLTINGTSLPAGIYNSAGFTPSQQAFFVNTTGVITVAPASQGLSALESWRLNYFGTTAETPASSNTADPNGDEEVNLLEFATGQNPGSSAHATAVMVRTDLSVEFIYNRSITALISGTDFMVQWSDSLALGAWSSTGVSQEVIATAGDIQTVRATVAQGSTDTKFVRLRVLQP